MPGRCAALLLTAVLATACGTGADNGSRAAPSPEPAPTETAAATPAAAPPPVITGLCEVRDAVGDAPAADERFFAGPHDPLHRIARELEEADERSVAARLLEAKNRVESGLRERPPPEDLAARLDRLIEVTRQALASLGRPSPGCP